MNLSVVDISFSNDLLLGRMYLLTLVSKSRDISITLVFSENEIDEMPDIGSHATLELTGSGVEIDFGRNIAHVNTTIVPIRKSIAPDSNYIVAEMAEEIDMPLFSMLITTLSQMANVKIPPIKVPLTRVKIYMAKTYDFLQRSFFLDRYTFTTEHSKLVIRRQWKQEIKPALYGGEMTIIYFCRKCKHIEGIITVPIDDVPCEYIQAVLEFHFAFEYTAVISDDPKHLECVDFLTTGPTSLTI